MLRFPWWLVKWRKQRSFSCTIGVNARLAHPLASLPCLQSFHSEIFEEHEERSNSQE